MADTTVRLTVVLLDRFGAILSNRYPVDAAGRAGCLTFRHDTIHGYALFRGDELLDVQPIPRGPYCPSPIEPFVVTISAKFWTPTAD